MPPQSSQSAESTARMATATMRRSGSESDFSQAGDEPKKEYRVRKSSLIG